MSRQPEEYKAVAKFIGEMDESEVKLMLFALIMFKVDEYKKTMNASVNETLEGLKTAFEEWIS